MLKQKWQSKLVRLFISGITLVGANCILTDVSLATLPKVKVSLRDRRQLCTDAKIQDSILHLDRPVGLLSPGDLLLYRESLKYLINCGSQAVPALSVALQNPKRSVRSGAVLVLNKIGTEAIAALPALTSVLQDEDITIRMNAAIALAQIIQVTEVEIQPEAGDAISALMKMLMDQDEGVRSATAYALGEIGSDIYQTLQENALQSDSEQSNPEAERDLRQVLETIEVALFDIINISYTRGKYSTDTFSAADALDQINSGLLRAFINPGYSGYPGIQNVFPIPGGSQLATQVQAHLDTNRPAICRVEAIRYLLPRCRTK